MALDIPWNELPHDLKTSLRRQVERAPRREEP